MDEEQLVTKLRKLNEANIAFEKELRRDYGDVPADAAESVIAKTMQARRRKATEDAWRLAAPALDEIRSRRGTMMQFIPGESEGAALRVADALLARRKDLPDPNRLGRTSAADLAELAADTSADVVTVREVLRELRFRAEQGDESVRADVVRAERRLDEVVRAEPDTVRRREEYDRLGLAAERISDTLRAIETGAEDVGVRFDVYRDVRRRLDAGEIDRDQAQQILQTTLDATR